MTLRTSKVLIYVDRASRQWIVRDPDGNYWIVPVIEVPWEHRQPIERLQDMELEPVPGHYKYMLGIPF